MHCGPGDRSVPQAPTIFKSDGTTNGTINLGNCDHALAPAPGPTPVPACRLLAVLFLAVLPQLSLSAFLWRSKRLPGMFLTLYAGVFSLAYTLFLFGASGARSQEVTFLKCFLTIYSSLGIGVLVYLQRKDSKEISPCEKGCSSAEGVKTWAVNVTSWVFFVVIHFDLRIPLTSLWYMWAMYAFLCLLLIGFSKLMSRTLPMTLGGMGGLVVCAAIAWSMPVWCGMDEDDSYTALLQMALMAGLGIAVSWVLYSKKET